MLMLVINRFFYVSFYFNLCSNQVIFCYPFFVLYGCVMVFCRRINLVTINKRYLQISLQKGVPPSKLLTLGYKENLHKYLLELWFKHSPIQFLSKENRYLFCKFLFCLWWIVLEVSEVCNVIIIYRDKIILTIIHKLWYFNLLVNLICEYFSQYD